MLTRIPAINKPKSVSSAQALRDLQQVFNSSKFFAPWLSAEEKRVSRDQNQNKRKGWKNRQRIGVKIGHGGTLDPMATGVLIVGVGKGTKSLPGFLGCKKCYETTILFGAATDTYDTLGKVLNKAPYIHLTHETVEKALEKFRGKIMQRPPLYSALHVQGKRLYEYAREGKEVPVEIEERPVEVEDIQIIEWLEGGNHEYQWPAEEAAKGDKAVAEEVLHLTEVPGTSTGTGQAESTKEFSTGKRKRSMDSIADLLSESAPAPKRQELDTQLLMSGGLQIPDNAKPGPIDSEQASIQDMKATQNRAPSDRGPPAVKLRMTVTSGFYVRSLAHDLGKAVKSLGCMSELVRTRQENFVLGQNVLEMGAMDEGEDVWAPKLEAMLEDWHTRAVRSNGASGYGSQDDLVGSSTNGRLLSA